MLTPIAALYVGDRGLNSGLHAFIACSLPTEPSLPSFGLLINCMHIKYVSQCWPASVHQVSLSALMSILQFDTLDVNAHLKMQNHFKSNSLFLVNGKQISQTVARR